MCRRRSSALPVTASLGFFILIATGGMAVANSAEQSPPRPSGASKKSAESSSQRRAGEVILARAIQLHQAGQYEAAIHEYRLFLKQQPDNFIAHANLGAALAHQGEYAAAIEEYQKALAIHPGNPGVKFNLALAHYKAMELDEAARELGSLHVAEPDNLNFALLLGDCYFRLGEYKKVVGLLEPMEPRNGDNRALLYLLGTALIRDGQIAKGQVLVDKILRNGDSAEAHLMLGAARLAINDSPGAIDELSLAIKHNPRLPLAHSLYGKALLSSGHRTEALECFRDELAIDPNEFDSNLYLGALLNDDHHYDQAAPYLHRALQVRPGAPEVQFQIAIGDLGEGKIEEARKDLEALVRTSPNFVEAHVSLAKIYYRLRMKPEGDREQAIVRKLNAEAQKAQGNSTGNPGSPAVGGEHGASAESGSPTAPESPPPTPPR